jgi:hypothetical protein
MATSFVSQEQMLLGKAFGRKQSGRTIRKKCRNVWVATSTLKKIFQEVLILSGKER